MEKNNAIGPFGLLCIHHLFIDHRHIREVKGGMGGIRAAVWLAAWSLQAGCIQSKDTSADCGMMSRLLEALADRFVGARAS